MERAIAALQASKTQMKDAKLGYTLLSKYAALQRGRLGWCFRVCAVVCNSSFVRNLFPPPGARSVLYSLSPYTCSVKKYLTHSTD